jgi:hypothetical protein
MQSQDSVTLQASVELPISLALLLRLVKKAYGDAPIVKIEPASPGISIVRCQNRHNLKNFLAFAQFFVDSDLELSQFKIRTDDI